MSSSSPSSLRATLPPIAQRAVDRLLEGNRRFVAGTSQSARSWRPGLEQGQAPFAVVLGCADSRSPAELVFDQGLGDLFVVRVAGNVVAPSIAGSVEFAVDAFGANLVMVLGHTHCGAVAATLANLTHGHAAGDNVTDIIERISPALRTVVEAAGSPLPEPTVLLDLAVRANVRAAVSHLSHANRALEEAVRAGRLGLVGAVLNLETGVVELV